MAESAERYIDSQYTKTVVLLRNHYDASEVYVHTSQNSYGMGKTALLEQF